MSRHHAGTIQRSSSRKVAFAAIRARNAFRAGPSSLTFIRTRSRSGRASCWIGRCQCLAAKRSSAGGRGSRCEDALHAKIGARDLENDFLDRGAHPRRTAERKGDDRSRARSSDKQQQRCWASAAASVYYMPRPVSDAEPDADAAHRRAASAVSVCRQPDAARHARPARVRGGPPPCKNPDEEDVDRGHLSQAEHVEAPRQGTASIRTCCADWPSRIQPGLGMDITYSTPSQRSRLKGGALLSMFGMQCMAIGCACLFSAVKK